MRTVTYLSPVFFGNGECEFKYHGIFLPSGFELLLKTVGIVEEDDDVVDMDYPMGEPKEGDDITVELLLSDNKLTFTVTEVSHGIH